MLSVIILCVVMLSVVMLSVIMLNVTHKPFMLSVVMLNVVMLSVVTPIWQHGIIAGTIFSYDLIKSILFYFIL
jgi:hypothetical protein